MREATRQKILADTATSDAALPVVGIVRGPERRAYAGTRTPDRRKRQRRKEIMMNEPRVLSTYLGLEAGAIQILSAEGEPDSGVMRVRMPFYVGNSVAKIPGFGKPVYFGSSILPNIVAEGNRKIAARRQAMTVYSRHANAVNADRLPVGAVTNLEAEGKVGYATIEIAPTSEGRDVQALIRAGHLNASSLRSAQFAMAERKVNGELMLEPTSIALDGIDFAPDSPAMPTYGVEVLAAEAAVEPAPTQPPRRKHPMDDITIDGLRAENPALVTQIEAPLKARIGELEGKVNSLVEAEGTRRRDALVAEIASKFPSPEVALPELQKLCAEAKSADEVAALAMPLLLENLNQAKKEPDLAPADKLRAMWTPGGRGQTLTAEGTTTDEAPSVLGFSIPTN